MRIVLVMVGTSLLDKLTKYNQTSFIKAALEADVVQRVPDGLDYGFALSPSSVQTDIESLVAYAQSHSSSLPDTASQTRYADHGKIERLRRKKPGAQYLAQLMAYIWQYGAKADGKSLEDHDRRDISPGELASLSQLSPRLSSEDEVWLLCSESLESTVVGAILTEALRLQPDQDAETGSFLAQSKPRVKVEILTGVQIKDTDRLVQEGLSSMADIIDQAQVAAGEAGRVLLNITGGYKGIAPLITLLAFGLSGETIGIPVEVFYLYEESDDLLFLPGSDLFQLDIASILSNRSKWEKLYEGALHAEQWETTSFKDVVEAQPHLFVIKDNVLRLTATGRIMYEIFRHRRQR